MQTEKRIGSFYVTLFLIILSLLALFLTFDTYSKTRETRAAETWADTFGSRTSNDRISRTDFKLFHQGF